VLVAIPLLSPPDQKPGNGVIRYLIHQTLAMPFILFAGWLSAGVEASPSDLALTAQSTMMLALGFAFLLAIFPLQNWIPMLMEEASPYVVGFLLWLIPTAASIFGMSFLDRYGWLRNSPQVSLGLHIGGLLMIVSGGVWAAFQRDAGRVLAYAVTAETGFILLALGLDPKLGTDIVFLLLIPRGLSLVVWALALSALRAERGSLRYRDLQGVARGHPVAVAAMLVAGLSSAGFPLLAGFPPRLALWEGLARQDALSAAWMLLGSLGLATGAIRTLAACVSAAADSEWASHDSWVVRGMLAIGVLAIFAIGVFPQITNPLISQLPLLFQHLGQ
jgi:formate hydrogenlyase subunit 3/multisubunit Na+/H+ antiporter MnhD subunit